MVTQEHIRVLVWSADLATNGRGIPLPGSPSRGFPNPPREVAGEEAGQLLWEANAASLFARYGEVLPGRYEHGKPRFQNWTELELLRILACFEYQSCEVTDWPERAAFWWCYHLRNRLIHKLIGDAHSRGQWTSTPCPLPCDLPVPLPSKGGEGTPAGPSGPLTHGFATCICMRVSQRSPPDSAAGTHEADRPSRKRD
jgi:hypothetical protein